MGKVMAKIKLTNEVDLQALDRGLIRRDEVRSVEIEALVDTGATQLVIPADVAAFLGLQTVTMRRVRYANGQTASIPCMGAIRFEILGRAMVCDALVEATGTTALIGQIPLENLDLLVDPKTREVRVNPESPDMPLLDLLAVA